MDNSYQTIMSISDGITFTTLWLCNSEINDGFDGALVPGQGFQDFTRNLSWQMQVIR